MENAPIIRLGAIKPNPEVRERFDKWFDEFYYPEFIKLKGVVAIDRYRIHKESLSCPETMSISYFGDLKAFSAYSRDPKRITLQKDVRATWIDRYGGERIWEGLYSLVNSFGCEPLKVKKDDEGLNAKSTPVIHIDGLRQSADDSDRYAKWFSSTGSNVYIPLFARMPGIKRIDYFEYTGITTSAWVAGMPKQDPEYPPYISIFHFDSVKAYEEFVKSAELAAFREGIKTLFPDGLNYKWNVQYQLIKSWRK